MSAEQNDPRPLGGLDAVDLTNCDREAIHLLGRIQPTGFLIALSSDWNVTHMSANAPHWFAQPVEDMLGQSARELLAPDAAHAIGNCLATIRSASAGERALGVALFGDARLFDLAIHLSGATIVIECQPSEAAADVSPTGLLSTMTGRLRRTAGFIELCREAARQIKALTGFDRIMIYRFHPDGSGEVIAESLRAGAESFMGLRYPASDIPQQARALYERSWVRIISDVNAETVAIVPEFGAEGLPLDLSLGILRAVSPIHIEYLRNMGVGASMSISILRDDKLWGLIACHHATPKAVSVMRRTTAELFGQVFSLLLESRERDLDVEYEGKAREIHNQLMAAVASESATLDNVEGLITVMRGIIPCDGVGIWLGERATLDGSTPSAEEFLTLVRFLNRTAASRIFATNELGKLHAPALAYSEQASGVLAIPISRTPRDFVVFFRREVARSVTWAGNPNKPIAIGPLGSRLTPRKSFESWREIVRDQSTPWTGPELRVAEALRITLIEIILRLADLAEQERRSASARQKLLVAELNHRVRNILGLIQGLVARGKANAQSVEDYAGVLEGRVRALARAHDQITSHDWGPGGLTELIAAEGAAYLNGKFARIRCEGPDVLLQPQGFSTLALVVHELMTNSAKYGALHGTGGHVSLCWSIDPEGQLLIDWHEIGGPLVQKPTRRGFGSTLIERSIPHDLHGKTSIDYAPAGVKVHMVIPARHITLGSVTLAPVAIPARAPTGRLGGTVLLVEDNIIIALDAEEMLTELGAARVEIASSVEEALVLIASTTLSFAVLDVNLSVAFSFPAAAELQNRGVPFCFATGYGEDMKLPAAFADVPIVTKPYSIETLAIAIGKVAAQEQG